MNYDMSQREAYLPPLYEAIEVTREAIFSKVEDLSRVVGVGLAF